ncbi:MAG TPA: hypothetical protein VFU12_04225 [Glycomyces sp.]|nr:hypothetical protein [Glycomyces sp.]
MSRRTYTSLNGTLEYELLCDGCGARFDSGDDSFYSWPVLCDAAEAEGWLLGGAQRCTGCRADPAGPSAVGGPGGRGRLAVL